MTTKTRVDEDTRMVHFLPPVLVLSLCLGLAWVGRAAASSDEPQAQPADGETQSTADDTAASKDRFGSLLGDDREDGSDGDRLHWGPLYPSITVMSSGSSVGPELQLWLPDLGSSPLDLQLAGIYSIRNYQFYTAQFGLLPQRPHGPPSFSTSTTSIYPLAQLEKLSGAENHFVLYGTYRYRDFPAEDFYGVGFGSGDVDHTDYAMRDHLLEGVTGYHFSPRFAINFRTGLLMTSLGAGTDNGLPQLESRFDSFTAPALADPPDEVIFAGGAIADLRDDRSNPHQGAMLLFGVSRFEDRHGGPFEFTRVAGDVRFFVPLFSHKHVIALHGLLSADSPDSANRVPFYLQSSLGGSHYLRGYPAFRFRDDALTAFSVEYRFEPISKLELALFYDLGEVAPSVSALDFSEFKDSWGGGIRIKSKHRTLLRFDVARSTETTRYLVKTSPAF